MRKYRLFNFTLIELMVVIAIIATLAGLLLPTLQLARDRGKMGRWLGFKSALRSDTELLIYYDFQDGNPNKLENRAFGLNWPNYNSTKVNGTINQAQWANGRWRGKGGLLFNGINSYVTIPADNKIGAIPNDFTIECWIFPYKTNGTQTIVQLQGTIASNTNFSLTMRNNVLTLNYRTDPVLPAGQKKRTGQRANRTVNFNYGLNALKWQYVNITYSESQKTIKLYLNGKLMQTVAAANPLDIYVGQVWIGSYSGTNNFSGIIDELGIYHKAFTPKDVDNHYQMGAPR